MAVVKVCSQNCLKCKFCNLDRWIVGSKKYECLWCNMYHRFIDRSWGQCDKYETA